MYSSDDDFYDSDNYDYYDDRYGYSSDDDASDGNPFHTAWNRNSVPKKCIQSNDHGRSLQKRLYQMFQASEYCDVTLTAGVSTFKAHRIILAANSDYFNVMFSSTWSEALHGVVSFQDTSGITSTGLHAILEFSYTGSFAITESAVGDILEAARYFLMPEVTGICERYLLKGTSLNADNYTMRFETATNFEMKQVVEKCVSFVEGISVDLENYLDILEFAKASNSDTILGNVICFVSRELPNLICSEYLHDILGEKELHALLRVDRHGIFTDMSLMEFIVKWVGCDVEGRVGELPELLRNINFAVFDEDSLDVISHMPFISDNSDCQELIVVTRKYLTDIHEESRPYLVRFSGEDMILQSTDTFPSVTMKDALNIPTRIRDTDAISSTFFSVVALGNILFICGRYKFVHNDNGFMSCHSFDPLRNAWKELACLPGMRYNYCLVALVDHVYVIGGKESLNFQGTNRHDIYSMKDDKWLSTSPLPYYVSKHAAAALNGKIYVSGGESPAVTDAFLCFETVNNTWIPKAKLPNPLRDHSLVPCQDMLYQFGGTDGSSLLGYGFGYVDDKDDPRSVMEQEGFLRVECYNPVTNEWTVLRKHHAFESLKPLAGLAYMDMIYCVADYRVGDEEKSHIYHMGLLKLGPDASDIQIVKEIGDAKRKAHAFMHTFQHARFVVAHVPCRTISHINKRQDKMQDVENKTESLSSVIR